MPAKHDAQKDIDKFVESSSQSTKSKAGYTHELHEIHDEVDDETNPNYDLRSSKDSVGTKYPYEVSGFKFDCIRRENKHFGCIRSWIYNLTTTKFANGRSERDYYYESLLFRSSGGSQYKIYAIYKKSLS